jgi:putative radical SAM enzyme (TIGR03279 family)
MHTQVVLCPGYNDGEDLLRTIRELSAYYPAVQSLAVVPLGMTDHREGLAELSPVTPELALRTLEAVAPLQREFRRTRGTAFIYLADEWYRLLGRAVPGRPHYDGFPQIENGIGMTRHFLERLRRLRALFPGASGRGFRRITLVTGALFRSTLETAVRAKLARTGEEVEVEVLGVENDFFGRRVTVAGLLVAKDMIGALRERDPGDLLIIPPATLNEDDRFLDDMSLKDFEAAVGRPVQAGFRDRLW